MLDHTDFEITVEETYEFIERRIDELAINHVEVTAHGGNCVIEFEDVSRIVMKRDTAERRIQLEHTTGTIHRFYYDDVEEEWFNETTEVPLIASLNKMISEKVGRAIDLKEE